MIYADHAATTKPCQEAVNAMLQCMQTVYGNPSSLHAAGQAASAALDAARQSIARALHCTAREITFTSGGSEADNQALRSAARAGAAAGKRHIVSTAFEHHAVLHTLERLQEDGFTVTLLDVAPAGLVTAGQVEQALRPDTCLVSVMYANNEIGTIQPIAEIGALCRAHGIPFHTDAVQAVGHLPVDVQAENIDMLSMSAHKFAGPKGVGALYVRRGLPLFSLIEGGAQERGKRAGTENLPAIAGMAAALEAAQRHLKADTEHLAALQDRLLAGLSEIPGARLNGARSPRLPGSVNFSFADVEGESLLLLLDQQGICASTGSACTAGSLDPSHVLLALGQTPALARSSLRLTLGPENTAEETQTIIEAVRAATAYLRNFRQCLPADAPG